MARRRAPTSQADSTIWWRSSAPSTPPDRFHAVLASTDEAASLLFDLDGRLMGMTTPQRDADVVEVRTASGMLGAARRLLER